MAGKKTNKFISVLNIFIISIKKYFLYLDKFAHYTAFPVLGQIAGLFLLLAAAYYYNTNAAYISSLPFIAGNPSRMLAALLIIMLLPLALFLYSFYRYIIAFGALNLVFYALPAKRTVKKIDFKANENVIERRMFQYALLMLAVSILCLFPPLWLVLCLSFQVFALENNISPAKSIAASVKLTLGNMFYIISALVFVYFLTYWFLPELFIWTLDKISAVNFIAAKAEVYFSPLPYDAWNDILRLFGLNVHINSSDIAVSAVRAALSFIIIGFTLPLRCCCFTELYRLFDNEQIKEYSKEDEEIIKRAVSGRKKKSA